MLSIRMTRVGSKKKPFFRVVVTEARTKRESDFVETLGTYNPRTKPAQVELNKERVQHWLGKGARPSNSVRTLSDSSSRYSVPEISRRGRSSGSSRSGSPRWSA